MNAARLRDQYPVLRRAAYLNAGTCGPVPTASVEAAEAELRRELEEGRGSMAYFKRRMELAGRLRATYAERLGCESADVALTSSTTDGVASALAGLELGPGDEVVTSDTEHPGVFGPLALARDRQGVRIRAVPLADVADAVGPDTRLVACSHVSWITGEVAPIAELSELDAIVLLDGAQGLGAIPLDVGGLGCDLYAASGQKWLCGPEGTGLLYVAPAMRQRLAVTRPGFGAFEDANAGLDLRLRADAARHDPPANQGAALFAGALAAHDTLAEAGWDAVYERARALASGLASRLAEEGRDVRPRGETTLVAWRDEDAEATVKRAAEAGLIVRYLPGRGLVRASVGAWNDEDDLERLLKAVG
jgi:selenocysteine lyase/cysteine desulfurase